MQILNISNIILHAHFSFGTINCLKLTRIQHIPKLFANLIFDYLFNQQKYNLSFISSQLFHLIFRIILTETINVKNFHILKFSELQLIVYLITNIEIIIDLWHHCLKHIFYQCLKTLTNELKIQLPEKTLLTCYTCYIANI